VSERSDIFQLTLLKIIGSNSTNFENGCFHSLIMVDDYRPSTDFFPAWNFFKKKLTYSRLRFLLIIKLEGGSSGEYCHFGCGTKKRGPNKD